MLAELIGANSATSSPSLVGISLGAVAADVVAEHPGAEKLTGQQWGSGWTWRRSGGGVVTVWADAFGKVWRIEFIPTRGEHDSVDLPCVSAFPVQDSHVNLNFAIDWGICAARTEPDTFQLRDRSIFEADFQGQGDGQLQRALWYKSAVVMPPLPVSSGIIMARIESNKTVYHIGEPIMLRVTLINISDQRIFFFPAAPYSMDLDVIDGSGRPRVSSGRRGPWNGELRLNTIPLDPGQSAVTGYNDPRIHEAHVIAPWREWEDLRDWGYDLTQVGNYTIGIRSGTIGALAAGGPEFQTPIGKSNTLHITIIR